MNTRENLNPKKGLVVLAIDCVDAGAIASRIEYGVRTRERSIRVYISSSLAIVCTAIVVVEKQISRCLLGKLTSKMFQLLQPR